ncbi:hypothetical protein GCM10010169_07560 [Micromonospora fulviviridis]|nr:hypothetical protein GCM10010169_07560 [Micromonospora fulviviridis]
MIALLIAANLMINGAAPTNGGPGCRTGPRGRLACRPGCPFRRHGRAGARHAGGRAGALGTQALGTRAGGRSARRPSPGGRSARRRSARGRLARAKPPRLIKRFASPTGAILTQTS